MGTGPSGAGVERRNSRNPKRRTPKIPNPQAPSAENPEPPGAEHLHDVGQFRWSYFFHVFWPLMVASPQITVHPVLSSQDVSTSPRKTFVLSQFALVSHKDRTTLTSRSLRKKPPRAPLGPWNPPWVPGAPKGPLGPPRDPRRFAPASPQTQGKRTCGRRQDAVVGWRYSCAARSR